jgi:membrane protease YdiL (CAAX protease family)
MDKIREIVRRHQLIAFFILAYAITWAVWIPSYKLYYAGVISAWGAFGPALAGIFITRFVSPKQVDKSRKVPLLAFLLGLVVSALVYVLLAWMKLRPPWTLETVIWLILVGLLSAIPPAFVISSAFSRNESVRESLHSLIRPRGSAVYYLFALFIIPTTFWLGSVISEAFGQAAFWYIPPLHGWDAVRVVVFAFITQFFYGNALGEEVGWRGFALPRLQARASPLVASLVIALFWFAWHLPLKVLNPDDLSYLFYGLSFIPQSILLTWLFNRTNGSILSVGIAHVSYNVSGILLFPPSYAWLILQFIVVGILIIIDRMWERNTLENSSVVHRFPEQEPASGYSSA